MAAMAMGEDFVRRPVARARVPEHRGKQQKRSLAPPQESAPYSSDRGAEVLVTPEKVHVRSTVELRSKQKEDNRPVQREKGKAKVTQSSTPAKKQKKVAVPEDSSSEDLQPIPQPVEQGLSPGYDMSDAAQEEKDSEDEGDTAEPVRRLQDNYESWADAMKKPVTVDVNGFPYGRMKSSLEDDIKLYAKDLDPTTSWEAQPSTERKRFFSRLYADWEIKGPTKKINQKWFGPMITKVLIHSRWKINQLIDSGRARPLEIDLESWNTLAATRSTEAAQKRSEHMRSISKGKGSKAAQLKAIEKEALIKLSILHQRAPYETELQEEVAKQFTRLQEEKRLTPADYGKDIQDVRMQMNDMEGSMTRLELKMVASQERLEDMFKQMLSGQGVPTSMALPELHEPLISVKTIQIPEAALESPSSASPFIDALLLPIEVQKEGSVISAAEHHGGGGLLQEVPEAAPPEEIAKDGAVEPVPKSSDVILKAVVEEVNSEDVDVYAIPEPLKAMKSGTTFKSAKPNTAKVIPSKKGEASKRK